MRLLRRRSKDTNRRQRQPADDLAPPQSSYVYSARRSEATRSTGRQLDSTDTPVKSLGFVIRWAERLGLILLLLVVLFSAVNVLSLSPDVKVMPLVNNQSSLIMRPDSVYADAANRQIRSSIWNYNKITINTNKLQQGLLKQYSELSSVSVQLPLLAHRPIIYVQPSQPALVLTTKSGTAYVVGANGKALLQGSAASFKNLDLPIVNDQSGLQLSLNKQALSTADINFVQDVVTQLAAKQYAVSDMTLPSAASELDVHLNGQPYYIKFNLQDNNPKGETGTFLATVDQLKHQNITPSQYIDVRVSGRAYYQ
ncbi:MAG TPA: hypothetical protein VLF79_00405 [Candidatus Saccharimonadales bacterium]|nr:hypothetical protein [Candidatus Saccharimonadales bacterium]